MRCERGLAAVLAALLALGAAGVAAADEEIPAIEPDPFGEWRFVGFHVQGFPLDASGREGGLRWAVDQRLEVGSRQQISERLHFSGKLQVFGGQVAGDSDGLGAAFRSDERLQLRGWDFKGWDLVELWLRWDLPWLQVRIGQMGSHFGLGLLSNDGRDEDERFGFGTSRDLSDRLLLATRPFAPLGGFLADVAVAVGGGLVYRDENASLRQGDVGGEALAVIRWERGPDNLGLYAAGRFQQDDAGTMLRVFALDLAGSYQPEPDEAGPTFAGEAVLLTGVTDRVIRAERTGGSDLLAFGGVLQAGYRFALLGLHPRLEAGYASGDQTPYDEKVTRFSFDPSFRVGLVLFDWVMRELTALEAEQAADPDRVGQPLPGTGELPSQGRLAGAVYLFPTVSLEPVERLQLLAGFLSAWSSAPFGQAYPTFENGGVPTNSYGRSSPGRHLGLELDLGARYTQPIWRDLAVAADLQAGWFFPGAAFERPDGSRPPPVARILMRFALSW
ncbi:MAG: hypothetical protein GYA21_14100 [Myxococcales bacterium]|nr:hypothetical protein [Myxococcales bacterium]